MKDRKVTENNYSARPPLDINHPVGAVVFLRMMSSLAWLDSAFIGKDAKFASTFLSGAGLADVIAKKFVHTALTPAIVDVLQNIVLPNATIFALLIAFGDLAIGISLSLGLLTRFGVYLQSCVHLQTFSRLEARGADTIGFNAMLIVAGVICIVTGAGRNYGIDRFLLARWPSRAFLRLIA